MTEQMMKLQKSLVNVGYDEFLAYKKAYEIITNPVESEEPTELENNKDNELYQIFFNFSMVAFAFLLMAFVG